MITDEFFFFSLSLFLNQQEKKKNHPKKFHQKKKKKEVKALSYLNKSRSKKDDNYTLERDNKTRPFKKKIKKIKNSENSGPTVGELSQHFGRSDGGGGNF